MNKITIALTGMLLVLSPDVYAQNAANRATSAVSGLESLAGSAVAPPGGSQTLDLSTSSTTGGELPGGYGMKVGDKVLKFRGAVGVGDDRSNVKAGVGVPF